MSKHNISGMEYSRLFTQKLASAVKNLLVQFASAPIVCWDSPEFTRSTPNSDDEMKRVFLSFYQKQESSFSSENLTRHDFP